MPCHPFRAPLRASAPGWPPAFTRGSDRPPAGSFPAPRLPRARRPCTSERSGPISARSPKPVGRGSPTLGWFDSIAAPWGERSGNFNHEPLRISVRLRRADVRGLLAPTTGTRAVLVPKQTESCATARIRSAVGSAQRLFLAGYSGIAAISDDASHARGRWFETSRAHRGPPAAAPRPPKGLSKNAFRRFVS